MQKKSSSLASPIAHTALTVALSAALWGTGASAAIHPNTNVTAGSNQDTIDLVVNVDWDWAASVRQLGTGPNNANANGSNCPSSYYDPNISPAGGKTWPNDSNKNLCTHAVTLDKVYIENLLTQTAQSIYIMTNGRHKVGKFYVYKNAQFGKNVDIQLFNKEGRSYAEAAGTKTKDTSSYNFLGMAPGGNDTSGEKINPETYQQVGMVVAHELGHYFYALYDEYVGSTPVDATNPPGPATGDTEKLTIMNNHENYKRLSSAEDYTDANLRKTGQYRVYGQSAWETLTTDPANDSETANSVTQGNRVQYPAFKNYTPVAQGSLISAVDGNYAAPTVVFMGDITPPVSSYNTLVIDATLPSTAFAEAITTAKALVNRADVTAKWAILVSPGVSNPVDVVKAQTTSDANGKQTMVTELGNLTRRDGTFDISSAYTNAQGTQFSGRADGIPATMHVLTVQGASVPSTLTITAKTDKVAFNTVGFKTATPAPVVANSVPMTDLATKTGGTANTAKNANEAIKEMDRAAAEANGQQMFLISLNASDAFSTNFDSAFKIANDTTIDGNLLVTWYYDPTDASKLSFSLLKGGTAVTTGITTNRNDTEGYCEMTIPTSLANRAGGWVARATPTATITNGIDFEISSDTGVKLSTTVGGGTLADNKAPVIRARLGHAKTIIGATVTATVYNVATSAEVLTNKTLYDDGTHGDIKADDGVYSLSLSGMLPAGEYSVYVDAEVTSGNAKFSDNQLFANGTITLPDATITTDITRVSQTDFTLESGVTGVGDVTGANTSTASGGCSVNPNNSDFGLLSLLLAAMAGIGLRRKRMKA